MAGGSGLQRYNLKLCQINSNCAEVRNRFPESLPLPAIINFLPNDLSFLDGESEDATSHSLGLQWDTIKDDLSVRSVTRDKDFTKRGLVSLMMSAFDPKGQISPVMLEGKLMQRAICPQKDLDAFGCFRLDWDDPLPRCLHQQGED